MYCILMNHFGAFIVLIFKSIPPEREYLKLIHRALFDYYNSGQKFHLINVRFYTFFCFDTNLNQLNSRMYNICKKNS